MNNIKSLEQLFRRSASFRDLIGKSADYLDGYYQGFVDGRDAQRKSDIQVAQKLGLAPQRQGDKEEKDV